MALFSDPQTDDVTRPSGSALAIFAALSLLFVAELGAIGTIFKHRISFYCIDHWPPLACQTASMTLVSLYCVLGAVVLAAMLRPAPFRSLMASARFRGLPLLANLAGVALTFVPLRFLIEGQAMDKVAVSFGFWITGMLMILSGLALSFAPAAVWRRFASQAGAALVPAIAVGAVAPWLARLIRPSWASFEGVADVTFDAVVRLISLLGYEAEADASEKVIGAGEFFIRVSSQCSGIEGIALVTLFVTLYLWLFRADLRFPHALILYPIGLLASAFFNVLRISLLLIIGLEGNPGLAVGGFHSHAGWMMFTLVALGIVAAAQTVDWLKRAPREATLAPDHRAAPLPFWQDPVVARILPFAVFMASAMLASAFHSDPGVVYPFRALAVAAVMIPFLGLYAALGWRINSSAILVGLGIAALWIIVPVESAESAPYGTLTGGVLLAWLVLRGIGTTLLVPVFEELFFRDYLESRLRRGTGIGWAIFAAVISAGLFAALHDRWIEALIAGLGFSWLAARPGGRITDAILAHALANGLIFAVALATGRLEII